MRFFATCKLGLESTVSRQLRELGIEVENTFDAKVCFSGGFYEMAKALLWLRTAERVFLEVGSFTATSFEELFERTKALPWKNYLRPTTNIHVNGKSAKSELFSVSDCQSIVKKAIVEAVKQQYRVNSVPESGAEIIVEVGLLRNEATLALDCCGAGLSRRGYRTYNVAAPIAETLGAGLVLLSRFYGDGPLIDPMCGSGTIPIEAAMIAMNMAPSLQRVFSCENWHFLDPKTFVLAREEAQSLIKRQPLDITGCDIDSHCIDLCKRHAKKAGVMLNWKTAPVSELYSDSDRGVIICNPPYGERLLSKRDVEKLYAEMRTAFDRLPGWQLNIITAQLGFERMFGKSSDRRRKLTNGGIPCTLYQYYPKRTV